MKLTYALLLLASPSAFALGPIPNGTYAGPLTCSSPATPAFDAPVVLTVRETAMDIEMDGDLRTNTFLATEGNKFRVNPDKENGEGYFTADGLVYEMVLMGAKARDEFHHADGKIDETGIANYDGEVFTCHGSYLKQ